MAQDPDHSTAQIFLLETYRYYAGLMRAAATESGSDAPAGLSLGGRLFWAGELDEMGRALVVAGNVGGVATLAATSDADLQRQALRDGIVDFLVNSLDEALRILKNEVRKRGTVAVCVAAPVAAVECEMAERGVRPDILREGLVRSAEAGASPIERRRDLGVDPMSVQALVVWRVDRSPVLWLPKLDAIALECLDSDETIARRWLQRASRYLGRLGQTVHLVWANRESAARFVEGTRELVDRGGIAVSGRIEVTSPVGTDLLLFSPPASGSPEPQA